MPAKLSKGDEIVMTGTVSRVHPEEYGQRRVTVRLEGFDYPITVADAYVIVAKAEQPAPAKKPARRKGALFDVPD